MTTYKPMLYLGDLDGPEGNAFVMLGRAKRVAKDEGLDWEAINAEATSGDYENLKKVLKKHFQAVVLSSVNTKPL